MSGRVFVIDIGNIYRVYKYRQNGDPIFDIDVYNDGIWTTQDKVYQFHEMLNIIVGHCNISGHDAAVQLLNRPVTTSQLRHAY